MLKRLLKSVKEYKTQTILTPVFVACETIMELLIPFLTASLIDNGIEKGDMEFVKMMGIILIGATCISLFFGIISGLTSARAAAGVAKNIRQDVYYKIQNLSFANIDKFSTPSLITRLTTDVNNVQMAYQMVIRVAARSPIMLFFSLIMSFTISARLSLIFLLIIPILGFGLYYIIRIAHPIFVKVFETYDKLNRVIQENLRGIRVVKSFVRENHEIGKFEEVSESIFKDFTRAEKILAFNNPLMQFSVYTCILLVSWFGAKMVVGSDLTTGQLVSLFAYTSRILMSLMLFSMVFVMITISRNSAERIVEVLDEEVDLKNPENPITEIKDGSIIFKNVSFSYAKSLEKLCLKEVDLEIKSGETIGIIGGTGSSKSSFVQLIPRLYDTTVGEILVGGVDVKEYDIQTLRNEVAMVLQKNVLFSGTIKENLRWGNENATDEEMINACKLAQADEFIQNFPDKYDTYIEQGGSNVSGGQRQRLCIARALLKKPKILILDDSTSAVDTKTDALIRKAFKEFIPEVTKIIIAQRISSIEDADKIIVLDDGNVNGMGTHEELLDNNNIYKEVYYSQVRGQISDEAN